MPAWAERVHGQQADVRGAVEQRYEPRPDRNAELRCELVKLARQKPRYGYRRLHALLSRRGYEVNVKRVYRLYLEEGLRTGRLDWSTSSRASRCRTATSKASTAGCATSASTRAGSDPERCARDAGELAAGVQLRTPAQLAGLQNAGGVPAANWLCECGKQRTLPTFAQPRRLLR